MCIRQKKCKRNKKHESKDDIVHSYKCNRITKSAIEHDREFNNSQMLWTKTGEAKTYIF